MVDLHRLLAKALVDSLAPRELAMVEQMLRGYDEVQAMPEPFDINPVGLLHVVVCTTLTDADEIARRLELAYPAGNEECWTLLFRGLDIPCGGHPDRKHWVFEI